MGMTSLKFKTRLVKISRNSLTQTPMIAVRIKEASQVFMKLNLEEFMTKKGLIKMMALQN